MRRFLFAMLLAAAACGNPVPGELGTAPEPSATPPSASADTQGEAIKPPFAVRDDLSGLLLVWFDKDGLHTAGSRSEIPEARRKVVRVDSLEVPPEKRLDPEFVYVADVRNPTGDGSYVVRKLPRAAFDAMADRAEGPVATANTGDVVLYKASWCGACKAAEAYMKSRGVAYQAYDIEKDSKAAAEMQQKVKAAGKVARGVPVIDWKGEIMLGFDKARMQSLIDG